MLVTSVASASAIKLSDVFNGSVPTDIEEDPIKRLQYQAAAQTKFSRKVDDIRLMEDQFERFYGPLSRQKENKANRKRDRMIATALFDTLKKQEDKLSMAMMLSKGHEFVDAPGIVGGHFITLGHHVALKRQIEEISRKIAAQVADMVQLKAEQQEVQDQADRYALIKCLTFLNFYSALPNDDFNYHEYKVPLTTLSSDVVPTLRRVVNAYVAHAEQTAVRVVVDREFSKFEEALDKNMYSCPLIGFHHTTIGVILSKNFRIPDETQGAITTSIVPWLLEKYTGQNEERYDYSSEPIRQEEDDFQEAIDPKLDDLRADRQIKASMMKWKSKINMAPGSLIQRLGLESAFFNSDFSIITYPYMLSFTDLQRKLEGTNLIPYPDTLKDHKVWSLGKMQLTLNFFSALKEKNEQTLKRILPILQFVENKTQGISALSKTSIQGDKSGFKQLLTQNKTMAIEHAYLKYISYANMFYALSHDHEGKEVPELKIVDPAVEEFLDKPLATEFRLDHIMAAKAHKWGSRVLEHGEEFITEKGLQAHIFFQKKAKKG